jgi:tellurite resistance protein TerC
MIKRVFHLTYTTGRRIAIAIVGTSVLLLGIVMLVAPGPAFIVIPGPAFIVIPVGLAILAIEFVWARHWLKKLREMISRRSAVSRGDRAQMHR